MQAALAQVQADLDRQRAAEPSEPSAASADTPADAMVGPIGPAVTGVADRSPALQPELDPRSDTVPAQSPAADRPAGPRVSAETPRPVPATLSEAVLELSRTALDAAASRLHPAPQPARPPRHMVGARRTDRPWQISYIIGHPCGGTEAIRHYPCQPGAAVSA